jgi:hypothetical protein
MEGKPAPGRYSIPSKSRRGKHPGPLPTHHDDSAVAKIPGQSIKRHRSFPDLQMADDECHVQKIQPARLSQLPGHS